MFKMSHTKRENTSPSHVVEHETRGNGGKTRMILSSLIDVRHTLHTHVYAAEQPVPL